MELLFQPVTEYDLLTAFKEQRTTNPVPPSVTHVCFLVDQRIAAVASRPASSACPSPLEFEFIADPDERKPLLGSIRERLTRDNERPLEALLAEQTVFSSPAADDALELIHTYPNAYAYYMTEIDYLLEQAEAVQKRMKPVAPKAAATPVPPIDTYSEHTRTQYYLRELATLLDMDCWMASNDKNREFQGETLGQECMTDLPAFPLSHNARKGIGFIDTIWFKDLSPRMIFEVECTTSVYSGLLRFADMLTVLPQPQMEFFIVAPRARQEKVMKELQRPVFQWIGLTAHCRFLATEDIETLYQRLQGLQGHIRESVLDAIAFSAFPKED